MIDANVTKWLDELDEDLDVFWQGPLSTSEHLAKFGGVVPDVLLGMWQRIGFSGFLDGAMWLIDPLQWGRISEQVLRGIALPSVEPGSLLVPVARNAFGALWFWAPGAGVCLEINLANGTYAPWASPTLNLGPELDMAMWLRAMNRHRGDIYDLRDRGMFEQALRELGPLGPDQCYGFVPSLLLFGEPELRNLQKVGVLNHVQLLEMMRRGEFTVSAEMSENPASSGRVFHLGPTELANLMHGEQAFGRRPELPDLEIPVVHAIRALANDVVRNGHLRWWDAAVATLVNTGADRSARPGAVPGKAYEVSVYGTTAAGDVVGVPADLSASVHAQVFTVVAREMVEVLQPQWAGWKMSVFDDGRPSAVVVTIDPPAALGWTSSVADAHLSRAQVVEALWPPNR